MDIQTILSRFSGVKPSGDGKFVARCPAHNDAHQSLSILPPDVRGKVGLKCFAGCEYKAILSAAGLTANDMYTEKKQPWKFIREHLYTDEKGVVKWKKQLYDVGDGKKTGIWKTLVNDKWENKITTVEKPLLYNILGVIKEQKLVIFAEGEKDADTIISLGFCGTSLKGGGAESFPKKALRYIKGKQIIVITDNDPTGSEHEKIIKKAIPTAKIIKSIQFLQDLKPKGDITDVFEILGAEKTKEKLLELISSENFEIPQFTSQQFSTSKEPYEFLNGISDPLCRSQAFEMLDNEAKKLGIKNFKNNFLEFQKSQKRNSINDNFTEFLGQPLELLCGDFDTSFNVVSKDGEAFLKHPLIITQTLQNLDTGEHKVTLSFSRDNLNWKNITVPKDAIAYSRKIPELSNLGILVNSENAKTVVEYLTELEALNEKTIPHKKSVTRLGDFNSNGFAPYSKDIIFDGEQNFKTLYNAIKPCGSSELWKKEITKYSKKSKIFTILISASFASVLCHILNISPFFVHVFGSKSGTGKTVLAKAAASVWGNPNKYLQSTNSTSTSLELTSAFFNHLPLILNELELVKDRFGKKRFNVYALCEGKGKSRGTKNLGLRNTPTWQNIIISNGESPITEENSKAGEQNRVIEIELADVLFSPNEGNNACKIFEENYGNYAEKFINYVNENKDLIKLSSDNFVFMFSKNGITGKQAQSGACILTAATILSNNNFFGSDFSLNIDDLIDFLKTNEQVDMGIRMYEYFCNWIISNRAYFKNLNLGTDDNNVAQIRYGDILDGRVYIIKSVFNDECKKIGQNPTAVLSSLKENGKIICSGKRLDFSRRINGAPTNVVNFELYIK